MSEYVKLSDSNTVVYHVVQFNKNYNSFKILGTFLNIIYAENLIKEIMFNNVLSHNRVSTRLTPDSKNTIYSKDDCDFWIKTISIGLHSDLYLTTP